jgi:hypothetical protein
LKQNKNLFFYVLKKKDRKGWIDVLNHEDPRELYRRMSGLMIWDKGEYKVVCRRVLNGDYGGRK